MTTYVISFAQHGSPENNLRKEVLENVANPRKRTKEFIEEIHVLISLLARRAGHYIVAKKVGCNVLKLPNYDISSTFSVSDLV